MIEFCIQEKISKIIEEYSNLPVLPFTIKVSSVHKNFYNTENENDLYFKVLLSLLNLTEDYKKIYREDGRYLLYFYIDEDKINYECNIEIKKFE